MTLSELVIRMGREIAANEARAAAAAATCLRVAGDLRLLVERLRDLESWARPLGYKRRDRKK